MICFYHKSDFDGICSAAIVKSVYPDIELYPIDHSDTLPISVIDKHKDLIIVVDFSFDMGTMITMHNTAMDFIWIDHHKSAIDKYLEIPENFDGLREIGQAACELTWQYFYEEDMPTAVKLLGRYDVWQLTEIPNILEFQQGLKRYTFNPHDDIWQSLLWDDSNVITEIISHGKVILDYQRMENKKTMLSYAIRKKFEGYNCLIANTTVRNSQLFDGYEEHFNDIDIFIVYSFTNKGNWVVSLYSNNDDVDVSKIATKYGGGGHMGAAGFTYKSSPIGLFDLTTC